LKTCRNEATGASKLNTAKSEPTAEPTVTVLLVEYRAPTACQVHWTDVALVQDEVTQTLSDTADDAVES
jgi:hypothetical protein